MDSGHDIFDKEWPTTGISVLRSNLDPIIKDQLLELSYKNKNKHKLKRIFEENPFFVKSFERKHSEFVSSMKGFIES